MTDLNFWIGTYSASGGKGLYPAHLERDGNIDVGKPDTRITNASFGVWSASRPVVWFVEEQERGTLSGWRLQDGMWHPLGSVGTGGSAPCFADVSPDGQLLAVANYASGSVALVAIDQATCAPTRLTCVLPGFGSGADPGRQDASHIHCVRFADEGKLLYHVDLGTDRVMVSDVEGCTLTNTRVAFQAPAGMGPRHLAFDRNQKRGFLNGELTARLLMLARHADTLVEVHSVGTDPTSKTENLGGHLLQRGDIVWTSNRGAQSLAGFRINGERIDEYRVLQSGGKSPRHFAPVGAYFVIANERDGMVTVVDPARGDVVSQRAIPGAAFVLCNRAGQSNRQRV